MERRATHAGSWYSADPQHLASELDNWLAAVPPASTEGTRAIIAPHAGYSYSGATAAYAYAAIDIAPIKRVFLLGPSHHHYLPGCALTPFNTYSTPLGALRIDRQVTNRLRATGQFEIMPESVDEAEHSIELHLPYLRHVFASKEITIVPILVGALSPEKEHALAIELVPYINDPENLWIISTDFCHWGRRFGYTYYEQDIAVSGGTGGVHLKRGEQIKVNREWEIWKSISQLDHAGMDAIVFVTDPLSTPENPLSASVGIKPASVAVTEFKTHIDKTGNTICGRHPVSLLLKTCAVLDEQTKNDKQRGMYQLGWRHYAQSSRCTTVDDSSVSYASGVLRLATP